MLRFELIGENGHSFNVSFEEEWELFLYLRERSYEDKDLCRYKDPRIIRSKWKDYFDDENCIRINLLKEIIND